MEKIIVIAWGKWKHRNKVKFGIVNYSNNCCYFGYTIFHNSDSYGKVININTIEAGIMVHKHWVPPPDNWVKINVNTSGTSYYLICLIQLCVNRDSNYRVIAAIAKKVEDCPILIDLKTATWLGLKKIIVESNEQMVIKSVTRINYSP